MSVKFPHSVNELPTEPYYAILTPKSTYVEGDERSRTNPGHGYPAHTEHSWDMEVYLDRDSFETEVKRLAGLAFKSDFQAVVISPIKITTTTHIEIKLEHQSNEKSVSA